MRVRALAKRILNQMRRDRRTLALMMLAPMLLLAIINLILDNTTHEFDIGVINAPQAYIERLEDYNLKAHRLTAEEAAIAMEKGEISASLFMESGRAYIEIDGSKPGKAAQIAAALEQAGIPQFQNRPDLKAEITYVYGAEDLSDFDSLGSVLIGFVIFFFVFLIAGISFLQERTTGTLEKLLSTPMKRWEIVVGYILGFGVVTSLQSLLIAGFCVYVLDMMMVGSFLLVMLITLLGALTALSLGTLLSTAANSEFQMIQFIPLVIVPQVFFSGLFELSPTWEAIGKILPLYYIAEALRAVMLKGSGFGDIIFPLSVVLGFSVVFMTLNVLLLKKHRRI